MKDFLKIIISVAVGISIALVVTLPIVLTNDKVDVPTDPPSGDPGAQRFPEHDFVTFDDLWNGKLSYKSFSSSFSVTDPDYYLCTKNGEYYKRKVTEYYIGKVNRTLLININC